MAAERIHRRNKEVKLSDELIKAAVGSE